ncbi:MAG: hypothetical protein AB7G13_36190 [Lautropia sp.]
MYIIAIGWLYVVLLMAFAETGVVAGIATFLFYGLAPVALLVYLLGTPRRRRELARRAAAEAAVGTATTAEPTAEPTAATTADPTARSTPPSDRTRGRAGSSSSG